ncbi:hypothetical protein D4764_03G0003600 [Takifugu flavidus]|uniref:Uncharacterized protein n=1 Tax=Takifugu flavidus TaxID=433684 RepID=A0A5C6N7B5_9TELE|nr:hypothetical protein D4764_03G0003600 [Takifugu flavidus]
MKLSSPLSPRCKWFRTVVVPPGAGPAHVCRHPNEFHDALTSQSAQGRCPGGRAEQAHRREQDHRRTAASHPGLSRFGKWSSARSDFSTQVQNCCFQLRRIPNPISPGFSHRSSSSSTAGGFLSSGPTC